MNQDSRKCIASGHFVLATAIVVAASGACTLTDTIAANQTDSGALNNDASAPLPDASAASDTQPSGDAQNDAATSVCGTPIASPGRGVVSPVFTSSVFGNTTNVAVSCNSLYITSPAGTGARPWEEGVLTKCDIGNCTATATTIPSFDLHYPAGFSRMGGEVLLYGRQQPYSLQSGPLDTPGDVLRIADGGGVTNLGPILDPLAGFAATFSGVSILQNDLVASRRTYHNHGDWRDVLVLGGYATTKTVTTVAAGGEVSGYRAAGWFDPVAQTARMYALGGTSSSSGIQLVNVSPATTTSLFGAPTHYSFLGTKPSAISGTDGGTPSQLTCESATTCSTPTLVLNPALPTTGVSFFGAFHGELIWQNLMNGDIMSCSLSTWATQACVPQTIAPAAPMRQGDAADASAGALFYVDTGGRVISVGL